MNTLPYHFIRAWGTLLASFEYYIKGEIALAQNDNAPPKAIYKKEDGTWATFDEIKNADTRNTIQRMVKMVVNTL